MARPANHSLTIVTVAICLCLIALVFWLRHRHDHGDQGFSTPIPSDRLTQPSP